ncbi:Hypothetical protein NTJ_01414 [Nesidiocoris tenuis]|uniref:Uncharacterized protein n=1 Tax=Nesidiocoris tenuis TaxID=355587 RepID=A0ABN7ABL0_9HEMI|nr:Hypothetical protein NTJ_01414 [Nesidiocoris tenuis]
MNYYGIIHGENIHEKSSNGIVQVESIIPGVVEVRGVFGDPGTLISFSLISSCQETVLILPGRTSLTWTSAFAPFIA